MRSLSLPLLALVVAAVHAGPHRSDDNTHNVVTSLLPRHYKQAQENSRVNLPGYNATDLYSGFFEIDAETNSQTYFMFSTAMSRRKDAPVLLWLNGGPGASSLLGFYDELGPFGVDQDMKLVPRAVSWNLDAHLLALDNPLGVGFSHTASADRMVTNQTTVGADLYTALDQFFDLFPELRSNAFYACGESYAGKYIPAVAHTIHERNAVAAKKINLQGIAIGDGAFDPPTQFTGFGPLLFNVGLADTRAMKVYEEYDNRLNAALEAGDLVGAFHSFDEMINGDYYGTDRTFYHNTTGMGSNYFNYADEPGAGSLTKRTFPAWLATPAVAKAMHVGTVPYHVMNQTVEHHLVGDWLRGVVPWLQTIMDNYDVLIYSGQYDIILGPPGTERAIDKLKWSGDQAYKAAPTETFSLVADGKSDLAGYTRQVKSARNTTFTYTMLRGCGHMVPTDQPVRAYTMLQRFLVPMKPLPSVDA